MAPDARRSFPFRRIEHLSPGTKPVLIETRCAFCPFTAASADQRLLNFAESAHACPGIRKFRKQQPARDISSPPH